MASIDGLITGLNTTQIISQLMALERAPQTRLQQRQTEARTIETELRGMRSDMQAIRTMAADLRLGSGWDRLAATSSHESVSVSAGSGNVSGEISFVVQQTAAAHTIYSNETVASLDTVIASGSSLSYSGTNALGFDNLSASGFPDGPISFEVTQDSAAATISGTTPGYPVTFTNGNGNVTIRVAGVDHDLDIAAGTYNDAASLATAVGQAITAAGADGALAVSVGASNELVFSSVAEGSAVDLTIVGGNASAKLGMTNGATASGTDGIVVVDGVSNTITDTGAGSTSLNGSGGTITADIVGPIRTGTATVENVGYGGGTLAEVVEAINNAGGLGYRAMAVNTGAGYRLQVMAAETGASSSVDLDTSQFSAFSGFTTLVSGRDAQIEIQGDNPYTITSSSNSFTDILPGVDVTVTQPTTGPVTVTVGEDNEAQADAIAEVVEAINKFLERADTATAANPGADPGLLFGNSAVRRTRDAILQAVTAGVSSSTFEAVSMAGITVTREGRLEFDRSKFIEASETDRGELERLFVAPTGDTDLGVLDRIVQAAEEATATGSGRLWSEAEATKSRIERWGDQIDAYETRFELREATLRRQYAALEVALGALSEQSNYLAGQLAGLPTTNPGG